MIRRQWIASVAAVGLLGASASTAHQAAETAPGEGVFCAWAIYSVVEQVGRRCAPDASPQVQAELRRAVVALEAYVVANSTELGPDEIQQFKAQQGGVGTPDALLCQGDALMMFETLAQRDPSGTELRASVDALVSRPGEPSWGTCL